MTKSYAQFMAEGNQPVSHHLADSQHFHEEAQRAKAAGNMQDYHHDMANHYSALADHQREQNQHEHAAESERMHQHHLNIAHPARPHD